MKKNITYDFAGTRAVVTGGAQGIGLRISEMYLAAGASVEIWDFAETSLKKAEETLKSHASRVQLSQVDVRSSESCKKASERMKGPVNFLVNNAGITRDKSLTKMTDDDFDAVIQTNL